MQIIAHRGCPLLHLENTINSFQKAVELGYKGIEVDVQATSDGYLIVFHDDNLERLTNGLDKRSIANLSYSEVQKINLNDGSKIPSLLEVLDKFEHLINFNIEIKSRNVALTLHSILKNRSPLTPYIISSFHWEEVLNYLTLSSATNTAFLCEKPTNQILQYLKSNNISSIHLSEECITKESLNKLKQENFLIRVYTVNELNRVLELKKWGVDAIFTDNHTLLSNPQILRYK